MPGIMAGVPLHFSDGEAEKGSCNLILKGIRGCQEKSERPLKKYHNENKQNEASVNTIEFMLKYSSFRWLRFDHTSLLCRF